VSRSISRPADSSVTSAFKSFLSSVVAVGAVVFALLAFSGPAAAATPCWKLLLLDWADNGRVDKVYPVACYHAALAHLPKDIATYSDAKQDIERALQQAVTSHAKVNSPVPYTTTTTETKVETTPAGTTTTKKVAVVTTTQAPTTTSSGKGPVVKAIDRINPSSPTAFPLPLLILGALAILLVLAGLGGMLYRRYAGGGDAGGGPGTA
jgi:hypothetical protein